jgi:hypothetical protein
VGLFNVQFTQRPPDDLIEIMGRLLDANVNSTRRKSERILITAETLRKLNLRSTECAVFIQGVPRRGILRDISFAGARIVIQGIVKFLLEKEASLRIDFEDPRESFLVKGKFNQAETVAFRKDMAVLNLAFQEGQIPMGYKMRVNEYLSTIRSAAEGDAPYSAKPAPAAGPEAAGGEAFPPEEEPGAAKNLGGAPQPAAAPKAAAPAAKPPAPKPAAGGKP